MILQHDCTRSSRYGCGHLCAHWERLGTPNGLPLYLPCFIATVPSVSPTIRTDQDVERTSSLSTSPWVGQQHYLADKLATAQNGTESTRTLGVPRFCTKIPSESSPWPSCMDMYQLLLPRTYLSIYPTLQESNIKLSLQFQP